NRVDNQVEQDLLQLNPISVDTRQTFRQLRSRRDAILQNLSTGQGYDLKHRLIDLHVLLPRRRLLDKGPDTVDDVAGLLAGADDTAERLPDLLQIRRLSLEPRQPGLTVTCGRGRPVTCLAGKRGHWCA